MTALPSSAQVTNEAYKDQLLYGRFGELCTMCEAILLCEEGETIPTHEAVPTAGSFGLYHLETRTFWSQISTIWEWFVVNFSSDSLAVRGHTRPANHYLVTFGRWQQPEKIEVKLTLEPGLITLGDSAINRETRQWFSTEGKPLGYCQRLPLWDALEAIEYNTGVTR
ncbi:MAG: hypothetical protein ACR2QG_08135 [Gammaproteobacteria bacterium]